MDYRKLFRVQPASKVDLSKIDPGYTAGYKDEASVNKKTEKHAQRLRGLQYDLYAERKWSLLICLQGLDSAGKDGTITHVLGAMDPLGTRVCDFKAPNEEEAAHDFLWRIEKQAPSKGEAVIFNRSHYEDVLYPRVHKLIPKQTWLKRYELINCFEEGLAANNTRLVKFFLYISQEEQLDRFKQRLDDPARQWKISEADYKERDFWSAYIQAYEDALSQTSTECAPWYIIPSNNKWFRNFAVSKIVIAELKSLGMKLPKPQVNIAEMRRKYHAEKKEGNGNSK